VTRRLAGDRQGAIEDLQKAVALGDSLAAAVLREMLLPEEAPP
jgi:hypothetical protein